MKFLKPLLCNQIKLRPVVISGTQGNVISVGFKYRGISGVTHSKKICIVGSGPAGFYAAQHLLKNLKDCCVDLIEKLPVPYGLVRYGVAPDHPEVKNVIHTFEKTAENVRLRFLGNISLGTDITLKELRQQYHAVLLTYGADKDRHLNIPNENQANIISARDFVGWYNGCPSARNLDPQLNCKTATIIGQGNVAIDVARILLTNVDILKKTDITDYALEALAKSQIERVNLVGRRGPLQAAFTIKELREMLKLPQVDTIWRKNDFQDVSGVIANLARPRKRLTELMLKSVGEQTSSRRDGIKQFVPIFLRAPNKFLNDSIQFDVMQLKNDTAFRTNEMETIPTNVILRSIGYYSSCVDADIYFDNVQGRVCNINGRVLRSANSQDLDKGLYVTGWLATGATGVIINTMNNAFSIAHNICDDILGKKIDTTTPRDGLPISHFRIVDWKAWQRIDEAEIMAGRAMGKPREKIVNIDEMLRVAGV